MDCGLPPERGAFVDLDLDPVALFDLPPERVRLREENVGVEREHAGVRLAREEEIENDALLLLERAREREVRVEPLEHHLDHTLGAEPLDIGRPDEFRRCMHVRFNLTTHEYC